MAVILRYLNKFGRSGGLLRHCGWLRPIPPATKM